MDPAQRRERLRTRVSALGLDAFLVTRPVNVRYLTGFTGSNGQLLLLREGEGVFFTDSRYDEQSRRETAPLTRRIYGGRFAGALADACGEAGVHRVGFEAAGVTFRTYRELAEALEADLVPTEDEVERLRWVKDAEEVARIEQAQAITDEAFDRLSSKLVEGVSEREAAFELEVALRQSGAERPAFDTIVAFGENAAEPHHRPTDRALQRGDVVKVDFGGVVDGYHSDMTRTVAFGEPAGEIRAIHDVVLRAQRAGIEAVRAGVTGGDADQAARRVIADAGYGEHFGHSLGHGVGLDIHEGPTLRAASEDVLPAGAVVTVEPGVYLPGIGGVRIEDMVVVGADGSRPLGRTPRDLTVL